MGGAEKRARPTQAPSQFTLARYEKLMQPFKQKRLSEPEKKLSATFYSPPRVKEESTRENRKNTSNTESKGYV